MSATLIAPSLKRECAKVSAPAPDSGAKGRVSDPWRRPLRQSFAYAAVGQGVYALTQWGTLAGLAKLGTPETVGYFALTIALTAPVVELTGLQLHVGQATDAAGQYRLRDYLTLRAVTGLVAFGMIFVLLFAGGRPGWFMITTLAMCLAKVVEGLSLICQGRFQRAERLDWVARSQVARGLLSLGGICLVFYWTKSLALAVATCAVLWAAVYFVHDLPVARSLEKHAGVSGGGADFVHLMRLLWTSLPLGLAVGLNTLSANIPRYFVDAYFGPQELGIFAALAYVGIGARLFYLPLIHTILPRLASLAQESKWQSFHQLLRKAFLLAVGTSAAIFFALALTGKVLLTVIYTPAYAEHNGLLLILGGGVLLHFVAAVAIAALQGCRRFTQVLTIYICGNLVLTAVVPLGIQIGGLAGAAFGTIFGALAELAAAIFWITRLPRENPPRKTSEPGSRGLPGDCGCQSPAVTSVVAE